MDRRSHIAEPRIAGARPARFAAVALALLLAASAPVRPADRTDDSGAAPAYDPLPDASAETLAELYYAAREVPGIAELSPRNKRALLDVVTERYKNRLVDRAAGFSAEFAETYLEHLARSELVGDFPAVMQQACAQQGVSSGPCSLHEGYVRRVRVLEEMLVRQHLSLDDLEIELVGATRPRYSSRLDH